MASIPAGCGIKELRQGGHPDFMFILALHSKDVIPFFFVEEKDLYIFF